MTKKSKSVAYLILIIISILLLFLIGFIVINYEKTGRNTYLLDKDYSCLGKEEIILKISQDFVLPENLIIVLPDHKELLFSTATISAKIDNRKTTETLINKNFNGNFLFFIKNFFKTKNHNLDLFIDNDKLNKEVDLIAQQIDKQYTPTTLLLKNNLISVAIGNTGIELDKDALINSIYYSLSKGIFNEKINTEIKVIGRVPSSSQIEETKLRAKKLVGKSLLLKKEETQKIIDSDILISWLSFENNYQNEKISRQIIELEQVFNRQPTNADFKIENNKVLSFIPHQNGIKIKNEALLSEIIISLDKLEQTQELSLEINIPSIVTEPEIKNKDTNNLGINELLGQGVSTFNHSSATRNINIQKGSSIINNILVPPGELFSFIKNLGEVSLRNGYTNAYIIRAGKTELDVGGGICQVSTTLFRAMLNSGLNITERKAHAYRVSYYEEDSKPGFDATVFIPSPDLKFTNDTKHHLLIQSYYDADNKTLVYKIYGTSDGRKVVIDNYKQWNYRQPPDDIYIDDPTLEVGKIIKTESRVPGLTTSFDWTVTSLTGQIIHQKTFKSVFVPWAASYRRGTKTN